MILTKNILRAAMPALKSVTSEMIDQHLSCLNPALDRFEINTPERVAAFLAQIAHESVQLTRFIENLNYSAKGLRDTFPKYFHSLAMAQSYARQPEKIANYVYANRMGNGTPASGDGWKYRGRGPIQITGRANYEVYGRMVGLDLIANPELALQPEGGWPVAGAYWHRNGLNGLADRDEFRQITKLINGGYNGLAERIAFWERAKTALGMAKTATSAN